MHGIDPKGPVRSGRWAEEGDLEAKLADGAVAAEVEGALTTSRSNKVLRAMVRRSPGFPVVRALTGTGLQAPAQEATSAAATVYATAEAVLNRPALSRGSIFAAAPAVDLCKVGNPWYDQQSRRRYRTFDV